MSDLVGSYSFNDFSDTSKKAEIVRLERQAKIIIQHEKEMLFSFGLSKNMHLLDIGCGPGFISNEIAGILEQGSVIGIDPSRHCIELATSNSRANNINNVRFCEGNIYNLSKYRSKFDFVYARFIFQHLIDPHRALINILNSLKRGGILCILDTDDKWISLYPSVNSFLDMIKVSGEAQRIKGGDRYIGRKLNTLLRSAGFTGLKSKINVITTEDIGIGLFLDLILKRQYLIQHMSNKFWIEYTKVKDFAVKNNSWGVLGLVFSSGVKSFHLSDKGTSV